MTSFLFSYIVSELKQRSMKHNSQIMIYLFLIFLMIMKLILVVHNFQMHDLQYQQYYRVNIHFLIACNPEMLLSQYSKWYLVVEYLLVLYNLQKHSYQYGLIHFGKQSFLEFGIWQMSNSQFL